MESRRSGEDRLRCAAVGLATPEEMQARLFAAARGEKVFDQNGPKIWMSVDTLMRLLTEDNRNLLSVIEHEHPSSVSALAERMGREQGNMSRTIGKLEKAGLVRLIQEGREKRPEVILKRLMIEMDFGTGQCSIATPA
jgi:predicted transcriptional regulator